MKKAIFIKILFILFFVFQFTNCKSILDSPPYSQLSESTTNSEEGINSVLNSAYAQAQRHYFRGAVEYALQPAFTTGKAYNVKGSFNRDAQPYTDFTWLSSSLFLSEFWNNLYGAIRDANIVLANINNKSFDADFKKEKKAEAQFLRAWTYTALYNRFGAVPLQKSPTDSLSLSRASGKEMKTFIETQLTNAANNLPLTQDQRGRATRGAALGVLCKFYLNTKQWQKSADVAKKIMDLGIYGLLDNYADIFSIDNKWNKEIIWALAYSVPNQGTNINAFILPKDYPFPKTNQRAYGTTSYLNDSFVNLFSDNDKRKDLILTKYTLSTGKEVQGLGNNKSLPIKYPLDPDANGAAGGNDIPVIRYADILLSRAEALNELNGPTQESIDLLNKVRGRAGLTTLALSNFNKESLRDKIFECRKKEFWLEGKGREDEIRHGVFISNAKNRGLHAEKHQKLFPIPQTEIDANKNLKQNPGY